MTQQQFVLVVDRTKSVEEMIVAGNYDYATPDINCERCPAVRDDTIGDATLFHFDVELSTEVCLSTLDKIGYRAADVSELLAFGATYPEEQRKYPIFALGQDVRGSDGYVFVGFLGHWCNERWLAITPRDSRWHQRCRFLAFCKNPVSKDVKPSLLVRMWQSCWRFFQNLYYRQLFWPVERPPE